MTKEELWELLSIQREKFEWYKFYCCICGELIKENDYYIAFVNGEIDYDYDNFINGEDDLDKLCENCWKKGEE